MVTDLHKLDQDITDYSLTSSHSFLTNNTLSKVRVGVRARNWKQGWNEFQIDLDFRSRVGIDGTLTIQNKNKMFVFFDISLMENQFDSGQQARKNNWSEREF